MAKRGVPPVTLFVLLFGLTFACVPQCGLADDSAQADKAAMDCDHLSHDDNASINRHISARNWIALEADYEQSASDAMACAEVYQDNAYSWWFISGQNYQKAAQMGCQGNDPDSARIASNLQLAVAIYRRVASSQAPEAAWAGQKVEQLDSPHGMTCAAILR